MRVRDLGPFLSAVLWLGITVWVLRPNMWLALQGDGAFYQSLAENGSAPLDAEQDLAYFPQRLSYLVPERLSVMALGTTEGYLAVRFLLAAALACLALAAVPKRVRPLAGPIVGVAVGSPPAVGWLSQDYPTLVMGLAVAAGAQAVARIPALTSRRSAIVAGATLGFVAAVMVYGHWGTARASLPLFLVGLVVLVLTPARAKAAAVLAGGAVGLLATAAVFSVLGLLLFKTGTPGDIVAYNRQALQIIDASPSPAVPYGRWSWAWWQTSLALLPLAAATPLVLRLRVGRWRRDAVVPAAVLGGQLGMAALYSPSFLSNTQYNLMIWPLALMLLAGAAGSFVGARMDGVRTVSVVIASVALGSLAVGVALVAVRTAGDLTFYLKVALVVAAAAAAWFAMTGFAVRRWWPKASLAEGAAAACGLVFVSYLLGAVQGIPPGVVPQGPSPAYPDLPPMAWIDYTKSYGPSALADVHNDLYEGAAGASDLVYETCTDQFVAYWPSQPSNGYLAWSVFAPYNSAAAAYPEVPPVDEPTCLVAIGSPDYFAETPSPAESADLIGSQRLGEVDGQPALGDVVMVYLVEPESR